MELSEQPASQKKIDEYSNRIAAGEPIESILEGLPPGMRKAVEDRVAGNTLEKNAETGDIPARLPPQYEGLPAEIIDELWIIPEYVDPGKTEEERKNKAKVLNKIRLGESEAEIRKEDKNLSLSEDAFNISKIKEDLGIKVENQQIADPEQIGSIESMSVEDFAVWLTEEAKKRGKSIVGAYDVLTARPEFRQVRIASAFGDSAPLMKIFHDNKQTLNQFREDTQSKMSAVDGVEYVTGTWDHYKIQYEKRERKETHKGYITIDKDYVLTKFTPEVRHEIIKNLRDNGYKGQVKFPVTGSRALFSYDNIVLHGNGPADVDRGLEIVQQTLTDHNLKYEAPRRGVDTEGTDGKKTSYTDRIAQLVEQAIKDPNIDLPAEIKKLK